MRDKETILKEVNSSIKTLTQPPSFRKWPKSGEVWGEWVNPDPIEGERHFYDKETRLIVELLVDIREALTQPNNPK